MNVMHWERQLELTLKWLDEIRSEDANAAYTPLI